MPWRLAERSSSTASWPLRGAPLPSRSSRARLCLAIGRLASTALRYHSMARVESRSTTKPRSYITPTLKADCAEPCWAARSSQPAPACWSLGTPTPCTSRRASSSMAGISSALALVAELVDRQRRPVDRQRSARRRPFGAVAAGVAGVSAAASLRREVGAGRLGWRRRLPESRSTPRALAAGVAGVAATGGRALAAFGSARRAPCPAASVSHAPAAPSRRHQDRAADQADVWAAVAAHAPTIADTGPRRRRRRAMAHDDQSGQQQDGAGLVRGRRARC